MPSPQLVEQREGELVVVADHGVRTIGRRAVEMLLASLRDGTLPVSEVIPVRLIERESTPARAGRRAAEPAAASAGAAGGGSP